MNENLPNTPEFENNLTLAASDVLQVYLSNLASPETTESRTATWKNIVKNHPMFSNNILEFASAVDKIIQVKKTCSTPEIANIGGDFWHLKDGAALLLADILIARISDEKDKIDKSKQENEIKAILEEIGITKEELKNQGFSLLDTIQLILLGKLKLKPQPPIPPQE